MNFVWWQVLITLATGGGLTIFGGYLADLRKMRQEERNLKRTTSLTDIEEFREAVSGLLALSAARRAKMESLNKSVNLASAFAQIAREASMNKTAPKPAVLEVIASLADLDAAYYRVQMCKIYSGEEATNLWQAHQRDIDTLGYLIHNTGNIGKAELALLRDSVAIIDARQRALVKTR